MQHATLPGSDATCRAGNGGQLLGREFSLLHSDSIWLVPRNASLALEVVDQHIDKPA
jgi:hypothetical protein